MSAPEFSRPVPVDRIGAAPTGHRITATPVECAALAERFGLAELTALAADLAVRREAAGVRVTGRVSGSAVQTCVVSGLPVPVSVDEPVDLLFSTAAGSALPDAEIELSEADLDILPFAGDAVDVGEVAAESLGLALDPFPRAGDRELAAYRARLLSEEEATALLATATASANPFAVLKGGKT